jgi:hypothetical protein
MSASFILATSRRTTIVESPIEKEGDGEATLPLPDLDPDREMRNGQRKL